MPEHVADRIADLLNEDRLAVNGARVLVLGVAYKRDVSDMRESPALEVMRLLRAKHADVSYHDPYVAEFDLDGTVYKNVELTDERLRTSDLVVILTDHRSLDYGRVVSEAGRVFDTRNATAGVGENREKIRKL
jgi:UDP-N-acetyl-D-glucosamine dehydrogenase